MKAITVTRCKAHAPCTFIVLKIGIRDLSEAVSEISKRQNDDAFGSDEHSPAISVHEATTCLGIQNDLPPANAYRRTVAILKKPKKIKCLLLHDMLEKESKCELVLTFMVYILHKLTLGFGPIGPK